MWRQTGVSERLAGRRSRLARAQGWGLSWGLPGGAALHMGSGVPPRVVQ